MPKRKQRTGKNTSLSTNKSDTDAESKEEVDEPGWLARFQTPKALEFMHVFVLLNSIVMIGTMGLPYLDEITDIITTIIRKLFWD